MAEIVNEEEKTRNDAEPVDALAENVAEAAEGEVEDPENPNQPMDYENWSGVDVLKSLCMSCGENGETKFMLHKIPYFRELLIASFECEHCCERNNEVSFGGEIQLQGCKYELLVTRPEDMDRQVIKSDSATIRIPELDFEIPPKTQKGEISTIEGFLSNAAKALSLFQAERMRETPEIGRKVADIILKLTMMASGDSSYLPYHFVVDDPAGNSFVQNPSAPAKDPNMSLRYYMRKPEQDLSLGLQPEKGTYKDDKDSNYLSLVNGKAFGNKQEETSSVENTVNKLEGNLTSLDYSKFEDEKVVNIPSPCPHCGVMGNSITAFTSIPHFKEVIIMAFNCDICGYKNSEIKGGGAVPTYGTEVKLTVEDADDMKRDVLKSDSAKVIIPELDLELQHGTLGGMYTTVDGLLQKIHKSLKEQNPFSYGDSTTLHHSGSNYISENKQRFLEFLLRLDEMAQGRALPFSLVLRDPLGNSFISARLGSFIPPELDPLLQIHDFKRSFEENEDFGFNDMNTKDFETGYENEEAEATVLPDRLAAPPRKVVDHPTVFAKGTYDNDSTQGGIFFESTAAVNKLKQSEIDTEDADANYCKPPPGWSFEKVSTSSSQAGPTLPSHSSLPPVTEEENEQDEIEHHNKRHFSDDSALKFLPYEEFSGRKEGFVFRLGSQGLGYYEDAKKTVPLQEEQK